MHQFKGSKKVQIRTVAFVFDLKFLLFRKKFEFLTSIETKLLNERKQNNDYYRLFI